MRTTDKHQIALDRRPEPPHSRFDPRVCEPVPWVWTPGPRQRGHRDRGRRRPRAFHDAEPLRRFTTAYSYSADIPLGNAEVGGPDQMHRRGARGALAPMALRRRRMVEVLSGSALGRASPRSGAHRFAIPPLCRLAAAIDRRGTTVMWILEATRRCRSEPLGRRGDDETGHGSAPVAVLDRPRTETGPGVGGWVSLLLIGAQSSPTASISRREHNDALCEPI